MSFKAQLFINDRVINVYSSQIHFSQAKDIAGKPTGRVNGGLFTLVVELDAKTDLLHQMMAIDQKVSGYVRFYKRNGMSKMTDYEFKGTHVYRYQVSQTANGTTPALVTIGFSPGALRIGDVIHRKPWCDEVFERVDQNTTSTTPAAQPKVHSIRFETLEEEPLRRLLVGEAIYVVVESTDMGRQETDVDLSGYAVGFEYQGQVVV